MTRLIDADALINEFNEAQIEFDEYYKGLGRAKVITDNAQTVPLPDFKEGYKQAIRDGKTNFSRQHGKWIKLPRYEGDTQPDFKCDICGYEITCFSEDNFCARCGADMRGEKE